MTGKITSEFIAVAEIGESVVGRFGFPKGILRRFCTSWGQRNAKNPARECAGFFGMTSVFIDWLPGLIALIQFLIKTDPGMLLATFPKMV